MRSYVRDNARYLLTASILLIILIHIIGDSAPPETVDLKLDIELVDLFLEFSLLLGKFSLSRFGIRHLSISKFTNKLYADLEINLTIYLLCIHLSVFGIKLFKTHF